MYELIIIVYLLVALAIIGLVLIQQGKGADMGASFGAGASASLFGSGGSGNFLTRSTSVLATIFFVLSLIIGNLTNNRVKQSQEWENLTDAAPVVIEQDVPASAPESDIPQ
ncbi:preprotein translocase subunit SecG [Neiella marina]|uniref:Protein-export membrane protein SecG n=1 Tax=Neiella holothuriorum TaxID=2870530 RepID=A0ABS7EF49_9GAMM|nr:preprotein translocase subunit SecG [Neiella holothuriorum]MBW8190986.1 preprotein translocase subunit SecG [Neiella holothuriorum]